mmetsp:Transcript_20250/g.48247  ORF Transcript_20250/g.48247 Transcript_20250/m.48247 type:complete len:737 (+) Transcript_20250:165-2375(+)
MAEEVDMDISSCHKSPAEEARSDGRGERRDSSDLIGVPSGQNSRCSDGESSPSSSSTWEGVTLLNRNLRSILMNRMTFEVFVGINQCSVVDVPGEGGDAAGVATNSNDASRCQDSDVTTPAKCSINQDFLQQITPDLPDAATFRNSTHAGLLSGAATGDGGKCETQITREMVSLLQRRFAERSELRPVAVAHVTNVSPKGNSEFVAVEEANVSTTSEKGKKPPRLDVSIGIDGRLLAFVEVGIIQASQDANDVTRARQVDTMFWEKVAQAHKYVERVYGQNGGVWKTDKNKKRTKTVMATGPLLFSVLVLDKFNLIGRMAIFSAEPKQEAGEYRAALIWRKEVSKTTNDAQQLNVIDQLDQAYGAFVAAVEYFANRFPANQHNSNWQYLGPDCVKVKVSNECKVLRAYDNRVRSTPRSPNVYLNLPELQEVTVPVLRFVDADGSSPGLNFEEHPDGGYDGKWSMLFNTEKNISGQVQVIAVPFHEGSHICKDLKQAYRMALALKRLHDQGFVHGDIRGCNCIFDDEKCTLIDFDFGGLAEKVSYPIGYTACLPDGYRPEETKKCIPITKHHDFQSLVDLLFRKHMLQLDRVLALLESAGNDEKKKQQICKLNDCQCTSLDEFVSCLKAAHDLNNVCLKPIENYQKFINKVEHQVKNDHPVAAAAAVPTAPAPKSNRQKKTPSAAQYSPFDVNVARKEKSTRRADPPDAKKPRTMEPKNAPVLGMSDRENRQPLSSK